MSARLAAGTLAALWPWIVFPLVALWRVRGGIRGVAFEPVPTTQALLQHTFALNGVPFALERAAVSGPSEESNPCR